MVSLVMLISETHLTDKNYFKLPFNSVYHTNHPAGTARGGSAIIIKNSIQHKLHNGYSSDYLQATTVSVVDSIGPLTISAVYFPTNPIVTKEHLDTYNNSLGKRFIAGGDYNAKHTAWGSRLITPRGRVVFKTMERLHLRHLSTGEPTYWPSDINKLPGLVDLCVTKGIPPTSATATSCFDLSSDHSPVLVSLANYPLPPVKPPHLSNQQTNWDLFRYLITDRLTLKIPLKTPEDIEEAVKLFNDTVQWAGWTATPSPPAPLHTHGCLPFIRQRLEEKQQLRKR
jgi:exonuclease III